MKRLHFGVNFGIERERCLSIEWVWSIRANAGYHEHRRSKFAFKISKCDLYREKFLLTERVNRFLVDTSTVYLPVRRNGA